MNLPFMKKENALHLVSVDEERFRLAHFSGKETTLELHEVVKKDIRGISEDELPKTIKAVLSDLNIKTVQAVLGIPSAVTTIKNIEIPSLDKEEIRSIINLQAGRHTPFSREEIIVGYANIGVYQRNYSKILLVIVNRNVIKKKIALLES